MASGSSQPWPISASCGKAKGVCSVCLKTFQVHLGNGLIHMHGHRDNRCLGSHKPPLSSDQDPPNDVPTNSSTGPPVRHSVLSTSSSQTPPEARTQDAAHPVLQRPTIRHIPSGARHVTGSLLARVLKSISENPQDLEGWQALLAFGGGVLMSARHGGRRHNITALIKRRVEAFSNDIETKNLAKYFEHQNGSQQASTIPKKCDWIAKAVAAKIEDGNVAAATRILYSAEEPILPDRNSAEILRSKHPSAPAVLQLKNQNEEVDPLQVEEEEILRAAKSFPLGSSGGMDGFRPQHLSELLSCATVRQPLLSALQGFVNTLLSGGCPPIYRPILFGGKLFALRKKDGGARPITIGYLWRRLSAKCAHRFALGKLSSFFGPCQLGVGIPGGCEAAVHATRRFLESMPPDFAVAKIDFSNAFNSISRSAFLEAVNNIVPEIGAFCWQAYAEASILQFGEFSLRSETGVQQGDPLGPLLFCLPLQDILSNLQSPLRVGFLDDVTIGGAIDTVASDVSSIIESSQKIGLRLNTTKCEIISSEAASPLPPAISGFARVPPNEATLLGASLGGDTATTELLQSKLNDISRGLSKMSMISRHDAFTILRQSVNSSRLTHLLRCCLCLDHPLLSTIDQCFRAGASKIFNLAFSELEWSQAILPVRDGGLGIRSVLQLALPAFLASAAGTEEIQTAVLSRASVGLDQCFIRALTAWSESSQSLPPHPCSVHKQGLWDRPLISRQIEHIFSKASSKSNQARLKAVSAPHASGWLTALPSARCGTKLDDEAVRLAMGLRLGSVICAPHTCRCGALVTALGTHGLSCPQGPARSARHTALNDIIHRSLNKAGVPSVKEPTGLSRQDGRRPDGCTLVPWESGRLAVWDVTVIDTLADSYIDRSAAAASAAAEIAAERKRQKYTNILGDHLFIPIAIESLGPFDTEGLSFLKKIGQLITQSTGETRETTFLFQRISIALQRFNALAIRLSLPLTRGRVEDE